MNINRWMKKYYSVTAEEIGRNYKLVSELVKHSLQKWKGVKPEILKQYSLLKRKSSFFIEDKLGNRFWCSSETCSLCEVFFDVDNNESEEYSECLKCPIFEMEGRPCFEEFNVFVNQDDPEPMIDLLEQTLNFIEEKENDLQGTLRTLQNQLANTTQLHMEVDPNDRRS